MKKLTLTLLFAIVAVAMQAATIYLKIDGTYVKKDAAYAYAWNGETKFLGGWPGTKMTDVQTVDETEYLVINIDTEGEYNLIFHNNSGAQTVDIKKLIGDYTFSYTGAQDNGKYTCNKTSGAPGSAPVTVSEIKIFGENYDSWTTGKVFTYVAENDEYVYTESDPTKLGGEFKLSVDGNIHFSTAAYRNVALSTTSDFKELSDVSNMVLTGCEDFVSATLTVKKSGDKWMLKIEGDKGVETHNVQLRGASYSWQDDAPAFTYDAENDQYVYEETETAKLAQPFKVTIDGSWYRADVALPTTDFTALYEGNNMTLSGAADYSKITLTVKKIDGAWKLKVEGEKETVVKIKGKFNEWNLTELEGSDGTYTITVTENIAQLADGFGFEIDGVYYAGDFELELDGDAVVMTGNPGSGNNIRLANDGHYEIILTVAKDGSNWTVKATQGEVSAVETIGAETATVVAGNGEIVVEGAQSVAVYTAAGALVSTDARTRVAAGLYIVRADNAVKKVIVK